MDDDLDKLLNLITGILKENQSNKVYLQKNNHLLKDICVRQSKEQEKLRDAVDENNRQKELLQDLMLEENPQLQKLEFENISLRAEIETLKASQDRNNEPQNKALEDIVQALQEKCDSLEGKLCSMDTIKNSNSDKEEKICALEKENAALLEKTNCVDSLQRENARLLKFVAENEELKETVTHLQDMLTAKDNDIEDLHKKCQCLEESDTIVDNHREENKVLKEILSECEDLKTDNSKLVSENKILTVKLPNLYDNKEAIELNEAKKLHDILREQQCDLQEELTCKPDLRVRNKMHDDLTTSVRGHVGRETQRDSLAVLGIDTPKQDTGPEMTCTGELNDFERMLASAVREDINSYSMPSNGNPDMDKKTEDEELLSSEPNCDTPSVEDLRMEHDRTVAELRRARDFMLRSLKGIKGNIT